MNFINLWLLFCSIVFAEPRKAVWVPEAKWDISQMRRAGISEEHSPCKKDGKSFICSLENGCQVEIAEPKESDRCSSRKLILRSSGLQKASELCLKLEAGLVHKYAFTNLTEGDVSLIGYRVDEELQGSHYFYGIWDVTQCQVKKVVEFEVPAPENGPFLLSSAVDKLAAERCRSSGTPACENPRVRQSYADLIREDEKREAQNHYRENLAHRPKIVVEGTRLGIQWGERPSSFRYFSDLNGKSFDWDTVLEASESKRKKPAPVPPSDSE